MIFTLKNDCMTVSVSSVGGEITSVKGCDETEYIWQASPLYWARHAPHLFPFVGRLTGETYSMDKQLFQLCTHGFLRDHEMKLLEQTDQKLVLFMKDDEQTKALFDRSFQVKLTYLLDGPHLNISFSVKNLDERIMYFGYGEHPGFNVPLEMGLSFEDYYLEFCEDCKPVQIGFSDTGYLAGSDLPFSLEGEKRLPLTHSLFDHDAIVLRNMAPAISIRSDKSSHGLTVTYPQMPYLGIWHKPHSEAPFVCIEPWVSLPARQNTVEIFEERHDLVVLAPGKNYVNQWGITIF